MSFPGFIGTSYQPSAYSLDTQITKTWHTERIESGAGKSAYGLIRTPERRVFCDPTADTGAVRVRGAIAENDRAFFVVGPKVIEVFSNGTYSALVGSVINDGLP